MVDTVSTRNSWNDDENKTHPPEAPVYPPLLPHESEDEHRAALFYVDHQRSDPLATAAETAEGERMSDELFETLYSNIRTGCNDTKENWQQMWKAAEREGLRKGLEEALGYAAWEKSRKGIRDAIQQRLQEIERDQGEKG